MTKRHFLDFLDLQETILELGILAYIFKREKCTPLELIDKFDLSTKDLKKKLKIMRKLKIIKVLKLKEKDFNSLIVQATEHLGIFFKKLYDQARSEKTIKSENENQYYILEEKSGSTEEKIKKREDFTITATPLFIELMDTIDYIIKSTEEKLREKGYL